MRLYLDKGKTEFLNVKGERWAVGKVWCAGSLSIPGVF